MINELRMLAEDLHSLSGTNKYATAMSKAADEIERLQNALKKANDQAEHFEREWYLRGDEIERLQEVSDEMFAAMTAALLLAPHSSGAYGVLNEAIKNIQPKWIRHGEVTS